MPSYALLLAYDGSDFAGWWRQGSARTVALTLDQAIARLGEGSAVVTGASRTDAGVHARGQVAHVQLQRSWRPDHLQRALAPHLPGDLSCLAVAGVPESFHATHHARGKTYSYWIDNGALADPFCRHVAWRPPFPPAARPAAGGCWPLLLPGRRDWRAFARRGEEREDLVRSVSSASWAANESFLVFTIEGEGFIYRLVRSLVGASVAVAHGSLDLEAFVAALAGEQTPAGQQQAPARGLCLEQVAYDPEPRWERFAGPGSGGPSPAGGGGPPVDRGSLEA